MSDLVFLSAYQLAKIIRERQVSSVEVLEAHLKQIAAHNSKVNAFITVDESGARQQAKAADQAVANGETWGVLHGVPITIKDVFETANLRTTCGWKGLSNYVPSQDATAVARLRSAGAVILGKTNLAILASDFQANSDFGRVNNPWNSEHTAGGSSGGSAAAVAAGFSPLDLCSGMGGSGRIPAHFCGVFGMKPTEFRVPMTGAWAQPLEGDRGLQLMYMAGAMTRSVTDLKLWLSVVEGADGKSWCVPPIVSENVEDRPLKHYRVAWTDGFGAIPASAETCTTLERVAQTLVEEHCIVEKINPPINFTSALETVGNLIGAWVSSRPIPKRPTLRDDLRRLVAGGAATNSVLRGTRFNLSQYGAALVQRDRFTTELEQFLMQWDVWLCPTVAIPAFPHQPTGKSLKIDGRSANYLATGVNYTGLFTLTGHPVVVVPLGQTKEGLPIGIQVVGRRWQDYFLLEFVEKLISKFGTWQRPSGY